MSSELTSPVPSTVATREVTLVYPFSEEEHRKGIETVNDQCLTETIQTDMKD